MLRIQEHGHVGDAPPLLLINGIGATADLFEPLIAAFHGVSDRHIICFDAPGVGGSSTPLLPMTMSCYASVVRQMLDELGYAQVDALGLSWGGALAQQLAWSSPSRVRRLVLAATMHGFPSVPGRPSAMAVLSTPARYYAPMYLRAVAPTLYGREIRSHRELLARHAHLRASRPPSPIGYLYQAMAITAWTSLPFLHRIEQRTLVLAGDDDPIVPAVNGSFLASRIPNAALHVVPGGGHLFLYMRADDMAERIGTFLDAP